MVRQGTRGRRREPQGIRQYLLCGGVVRLVRTPVTQEAVGSSPVAPPILLKLFRSQNVSPPISSAPPRSENATSRIGRGQTAPKGLIRVTVPPTFARLHLVSKLPAFFAYPDMAVELAASESPTTIIEDGFDLAIHSGDLPDSTLVARRFAQTMIILVATPQYLTRHGAPESPDDLHRFRSVVFVERGSIQPWSFGSGQDVKRVIPTGVFRTSDIEQMRMGVLEHLGIAQAPAWLFAAELREGTVVRLLTPFERTVPILAVRPASRRMSTKVRIFIEHLEKTFVLCSQFNPRPT
jgi:DNA-binding transcriptional LysR family regulator